MAYYIFQINYSEIPLAATFSIPIFFFTPTSSENSLGFPKRSSSKFWHENDQKPLEILLRLWCLASSRRFAKPVWPNKNSVFLDFLLWLAHPPEIQEILRFAVRKTNRERVFLGFPGLSSESKKIQENIVFNGSPPTRNPRNTPRFVFRKQKIQENIAFSGSPPTRNQIFQGISMIFFSHYFWYKKSNYSMIFIECSWFLVPKIRFLMIFIVFCLNID